MEPSSDGFFFGVIVLGIMGELDGCPSIPSLPVFLMVLGGVVLMTHTIQFVFRTERQKDLQELLPQRQQQMSKSVVVADTLALAVLAVSIWGCLLTIPHVQDALDTATATTQQQQQQQEDEDNPWMCPAIIFWMALLSAVFPVIVIVCLLLFWTFDASASWCRRRSRRYRDPPPPTAATLMEPFPPDAIHNPNDMAMMMDTDGFSSYERRTTPLPEESVLPPVHRT